MKKFIKMLSVIGITVIGALVSSCQVEDINTTFEPANAVAEITVTAFDLATGNEITASSDLKLTASSTASNPISITGNVLKIEGSPAVPEQTVTIEAEYKGQKGQTTVNVKSLLAGGKAGYGATVVVGSVSYKATATVQVSVWDIVSSKEVTADAAITLDGVPSGCLLEGDKGSYKITSDQAIPAFNLKVKAVYGGETKENTVSISKIELNETKHFGSSFTFGNVPVDEPAVARIVVSVRDNNLNQDVTEKAVISAALPSGSKATIETVGNVVTVTAGDDLKIAAQNVTITAQYDNRTETTEVALSELSPNTVSNYATTVFFQKAEPGTFAFVLVSVWDNAGKKDVTADATIALEGVPAGCTLTGEKGSYVISSVEAIPAFTLSVSATYNGETKKQDVKIDGIGKGEAKTFAASFEVGDVPAVDPAVANIVVTVKDLNLDKDVTDQAVISAALPTGSKATVKTVGNVVIVTAGDDLKIAAQTVTITAQYDNRTETTEVALSEIAVGTVGNYATSIFFQKEEPVAYAYIQLNVWDKTSGKDVTADATITFEGLPENCTITGEKGSYVISGIGVIPAFTLSVSAAYGGEPQTKNINIARVEAGKVMNYTSTIEVGTTPVVKDPAIAFITVSVKDNNLNKDVTAESVISATLTQGSAATVTTLGNVVKITAGADLKIAAQAVIVHIEYAGESKDIVYQLSEIAEGSVGNYSLTAEFNTVSYFINKVKSEETVEVGTFFSTHNLHTYTHDYSHAYGHDYGHGHASGQWLYNETEFILETTIDYTDIRGIVKREITYAAYATDDDKSKVNQLAAPYAENSIETPKILNVKVSAFAMYSAYATKITTIDTYDVTRVVNGDTVNAVSVGTVKVHTVATTAEYCEAAMPGHEGHYVHGHGHADEHGYSSNAGGGIVWAE